MREIEAPELKVVVCRLIGMDLSADHVVSARLKHMHRLDFPAGRRPDRGARRRYSFADCLLIGSAFSLLDAGMSSALAVEVASDCWPLLRLACREAASPGAGCLVMLDMRATAALGGRAGSKPPPWGKARLVARGATPMDAQEASAVAVVMDPVALVARLRSGLIQLPRIVGDEVDAAVQALDRG